MSGIFTAIGKSLRNVFSSSDDKEPVDKMSLMGNYELLIGTLHKVDDALKMPHVVEVFKVAAGGAPTSEFRRIYDRFLSASGSVGRRFESTAPMSSVTAAVGILLTDSTEIVTQIQSFGTADSSTTEIGSLRLSDAAVIGYYENAVMLCTWSAYMINIAADSVAGTTTAPYQLKWAFDHISDVEGFIRLVTSRRGSFMDGINAMRKSGKDIGLQTDGVTLDQYARDSEYDPAVLASAGGIMRSPVLMVGQWRVNNERLKSEELKSVKSWLDAKIGVMSLDMAKTDPESPEYRKQQKILAVYQRALADNARELAAHG